MTAVFWLAVGLLGVALFAGCACSWQYHFIAPANYRRFISSYNEFKEQRGEDKHFPATWEELEQLCNEPLNELEQTVVKAGAMEDRRVRWRRFVATELMPAGYVLHLAAISTALGAVLLTLWGIWRLLF